MITKAVVPPEEVNLEEAKKGIMFVPPKSAKGRRNITLTATAIEALRKKIDQEQEEQEVGDLGEDHGLCSLTRLVSPCTSG